MDELKNLVIQTLETNGILGQIRAKLRSSVFKVIDNNDPQHPEKAMHWENPLAQKVLETTESALAADLIREYLEFYRLDYTLSIMIPEANLKQDPLDKEELIKRSDVDQPNQSEPLLIQILKERKAGVKPKAQPERRQDPKPDMQVKSPQSTDEQKASKFKSASAVSKPEPKKDDLSYLSKPAEKPKQSPINKSKGKKDDESNEYDDDFDDDIEENLPVEDLDDDRDENKLFTESGNAFTGSQSMGMDPSVNTLAMDEYDHVEEVVRIG
jgi:FGFR1 oncogene partner